MSRKKGTVAKVISNQYGYAIVLEEQPGFYYNTKFQPKCKEGAKVGIEFDSKGDKRAQIRNIKIFEQGDGKARSSGGGSGDNQQSIRWQSAQLRAATLMQAMDLSHATNVEIEEQFDTLTVRLYDDSADPENSETYKRIKAREEDVDSAEDTGDGWDVTDQNDDGDGWDSWDG